MTRSFFKCDPKCPKRNPGCQDHCDTYLTAKAKHDSRKEEYYGNAQLRQYLAERCIKARDIHAKQKRDPKASKWSRD